MRTGELEFELLNKIFKPDLSERTQKIESMFRLLQNTSPEVRTSASRNIYDEGIDDAELYEAVASALKNQLVNLDRKSPRRLEQEVSWHAKALSCSGNQEYLPLLDELTKSPSKTVARHAKKSYKSLAKSADCE